MTRLQGYLAIIASTIVWGSVSLIVRLVSAPLTVVVFYRVAVAALALVAVLALTGRARSLLLPAAASVGMVGLGVLLAVDWLVYFAAIRMTSVASAVFAATSAPVFIAVLGPLVLRERPRSAALLATVLAVGGVGTMTVLDGSGEVRIPGVALGLASALTYASVVVAAKRLSSDYSPLVIAALQTAVAALVLLPFAGFAGIVVTPPDFGLLLLLGTVHTALVLTLYYYGLRQVPAQTAGVLALLEPLSASLLAAWLLSEPLTPATALGGALILAGVVLVRPPREPA